MDNDVLARGIGALAEVITEQHKAVVERANLRGMLKELGLVAFGHNQTRFSDLYSELHTRLKMANAMESNIKVLESSVFAGKDEIERLITQLNVEIQRREGLETTLSEALEGHSRIQDKLDAVFTENDNLRDLLSAERAAIVELNAQFGQKVQAYEDRLKESEKALAESEAAHWAGMQSKFEQHQQECQNKIALVEEQYKLNIATLKAENEKLLASQDEIVARHKVCSDNLAAANRKIKELEEALQANTSTLGGSGGVYPRTSAPTPVDSPVVEGAGQEVPAEGEPLLLDMQEFSKAMRKWIIKHGGNRSRALKAMGITIPTSMDSALFFKTTGTKRSKYAALFAKHLGPQILHKTPGRK